MNNKVKTNFDHYKYEIIAMMLPTSAVRCAFIKKNVLKSIDCSPITCKECSKKFEEWLQQPYEEPVVEIDWKKVPYDTPVFVWTDDTDVHIPRYFSTYDENAERKFGCFPDGQTSFSTSVPVNSYWRFCKLARPEDVEKYRKE